MFSNVVLGRVLDKYEQLLVAGLVRDCYGNLLTSMLSLDAVTILKPAYTLIFFT